MEIKNIYNTLSGGKSVLGDSFIISSKHFNSISRDRFITELKKLGIFWDGADITYLELINKNIESLSDFKSQTSQLNPIINSSIEIEYNNEVKLGIDIQEIAELPDCVDYWEDEFYNSKFTKQEIAYCLTKNNVKQSFSGVYSCKEALIKLDKNLSWDEINISYDFDGRPRFKNYAISISHSGSYSLGVAIKIGSGYNKPIENELDLNKFVDLGNSEDHKLAYKVKPFKVLYSLISLLFIYLILKDFVGFKNIQIVMQEFAQYF